MPAIKQKSAFNMSAAIKAHANDETEYGQDFGKLPPDISGIAKFSSATLGIYKNGVNKGKQFFRAVGTVMTPHKAVYSPKSWQGDAKSGRVVAGNAVEVTVRGKQTSIMIPLCDTVSQAERSTSAEEHVADMLNILRRCIAEEITAGLESDEDLKNLFKALSEDKTNDYYFKFTTNGSEPTFANPQQRVFENWIGNQDLDLSEIGVTETGQDNTGTPTAEVNGQAAPPDTQPGQDSDDLDALAALADKQDKQAVQRLGELALGVGISEEDIEKAESWGQIVELINTISAGGTVEDQGGEPAPPTKGAKVKYQVIDPRTKQPMVNPRSKKPMDPIECEVTSSDEKKKLVNLKNSKAPKIEYKGVAWDALLPA